MHTHTKKDDVQTYDSKGDTKYTQATDKVENQDKQQAQADLEKAMKD